MIDLTKILSHLPDTKISELETITQRIVDTEKAEIVVLFGSYARGNYKEKRGKIQGKKSDYDILLVVSEYEIKKELSSELRAVFTDISVHVQLIVEEINYVNSSLEEKQFFFTDIKREGKVLFNSGNFELSEFKELTPTRRREIAEEDFKQWFEKGINSYKKFDFCYKEKIYQEASFELQQTAEMCYTAIEMVFSHYNPYEHNLEILRKRVLQFDSRMKEVLPYETIEQKEQFDYLNFAYIGGRYRSEEDFPVTQEQLDYWRTEVKQLLVLTETICKERIDCLKGIEKGKR
ncbi:MAG: HEPN domain-containing protein [Bacteroidales bacterium]|nr:HEPN domain-containing protein [Bacteroidales bacterium]